jgi:hypothetical protein
MGTLRPHVSHFPISSLYTETRAWSDIFVGSDLTRHYHPPRAHEIHRDPGFGQAGSDKRAPCHGFRSLRRRVRVCCVSTGCPDDILLVNWREDQGAFVELNLVWSPAILFPRVFAVPETAGRVISRYDNRYEKASMRYALEGRTEPLGGGRAGGGERALSNQLSECGAASVPTLDDGPKLPLSAVALHTVTLIEA